MHGLLSNNQLLKDLRRLTSTKKSVKDLIKAGNFPASIDFEPEEAQRFFDESFDGTTLKKVAHIEPMDMEKKDLRHIAIGSNILYPAEVFGADKYFSEVTANKMQLSVEKARGCVFIHDDSLEDNIEGEAFVDHLLSMISDKIGNELEEMYYMSKKTNPATELTELLDGWRTQIINGQNAGDPYYNDATGGATVLSADDSSVFSEVSNQWIAETSGSAPYDTEFKFRGMLSRMHPRYRRRKKDLRFIAYDNIIDDYVTALEERGTVLGDKVITGEITPPFSSVPIVPAALMPTTITQDGETFGSGDTTDVILTPFKNFIIGIHRSLTIEPERRPESEVTAFWFSIRTDCKILDVAGVVMLRNVKLRNAANTKAIN